MGQGDPGHDTPSNEPLADGLDRDIMQRRQRIAELGSMQKAHEREFTELKEQYARVRAYLERTRHVLIGASRERTTLISELDQLLQRRMQRDNELLRTEAEEEKLRPPPLPTDIGAGDTTIITHSPAGVSEWTGPTGAPPAPRAHTAVPHSGPPPTAFPNPKPPSTPHLEQKDIITQVTQRPPALRSAAFDAKPAKLTTAPPPVPGHAHRTVQRPPPLPTPAGKHDAPQVAMAVEVDFGSDSNLFVGFSENISEGGVFVATYSPRRVGERMTVQFTLPGHHRAILVEVEVSWVINPSSVEDHHHGTVPGMGLRFVNLLEHDRQALVRFISQREPLFFPG